MKCGAGGELCGFPGKKNKTVLEQIKSKLQKITLCFVDYSEAFDYVDQEQLWVVWKETNAPALDCPIV